MNDLEKQFQNSEPASAVEIIWGEQVDIVSREYSLLELNEKTLGMNTEEKME